MSPIYMGIAGGIRGKAESMGVVLETQKCDSGKDGKVDGLNGLHNTCYNHPLMIAVLEELNVDRDLGLCVAQKRLFLYERLRISDRKFASIKHRCPPGSVTFQANLRAKALTRTKARAHNRSTQRIKEGIVNMWRVHLCENTFLQPQAYTVAKCTSSTSLNGALSDPVHSASIGT
ncbi:uncharacterized protein BJ212DRAFT_1586656 [Suillus subaureus]|uniref:Uncharacterized protein n=1 Tax=Suillus subaureus TaxID=48587 RepID=A0A9P7JFV5_9AGAM|nr:uncharacterized protein BJ212DRAFT_1586656 [Suillus subaureus]KAG1819850.1 hypothetical protein BJ212DRAFT_1586656 [Suillus subaureus]